MEYGTRQVEEILYMSSTCCGADPGVVRSVADLMTIFSSLWEDACSVVGFAVGYSRIRSKMYME